MSNLHSQKRHVKQNKKKHKVRHMCDEPRKQIPMDFI